MFKKWLIIAAAVVPVLAAGVAQADDWDEIADLIRTVPITPANPPTLNSPVNCQYPDNLRFTIDVLGSQNHQTWLGDSKAGDSHTVDTVVTAWKTAIDAVPDTGHSYGNLNIRYMKTAVAALLQAAKDASIEGEEFYVLLRKRFDSTLPNLTKAIDDMVKGDHFVFPLFKMDEGALKEATSLLKNGVFVVPFAGKGRGGFGSLTYRQLYHTPAYPDDFSDNQMLAIMQAQKRGLIRIFYCAPAVEVRDGEGTPDQTGDGDDVEAYVNYCCNISNRQCQPGTPPQYCNTCGPIYCCLGGVSWCP